MSAHTHAPWLVNEERDEKGDVLYISVIPEPLDGTRYCGRICSVFHAEHIGGITREESAANARLIAAAPDLLGALRSMREAVRITRACLLDSVETHGTHGGWLHEEATRLMAEEDACDAAIAKATGGAAC